MCGLLLRSWAAKERDNVTAGCRVRKGVFVFREKSLELGRDQ